MHIRTIKYLGNYQARSALKCHENQIVIKKISAFYGFNTYAVQCWTHLCGGLQFETIIPFTWNEVTVVYPLCYMTFK